MRGEQPQQLARDIAGAAENDRRCPFSHSLTACARRPPRPQALEDVIAELRRPTVSALHARTPICSSMIRTPDRVVGRGAGHGAWLDAEALAQQLDAAPRRDRIVRRQDDRGQRRGGCPAPTRIASTP